MASSPPSKGPMRFAHIRGWLLVFCLHALVTTMANAYYALRGWLRVVEFIPFYAFSPSARAFGAYRAGHAVLETVFVFLIGIGLDFTLSRDSRTRGYWRWALPCAILCQGAGLLLDVLYHTALAARRPSVQGPPLPPLVRLAILLSSIGVWWFYWERSRRVKESFPSRVVPSRDAAA